MKLINKVINLLQDLQINKNIMEKSFNLFVKYWPFWLTKVHAKTKT